MSKSQTSLRRRDICQKDDEIRRLTREKKQDKDRLRSQTKEIERLQRLLEETHLQAPSKRDKLVLYQGKRVIHLFLTTIVLIIKRAKIV